MKNKVKKPIVASPDKLKETLGKVLPEEPRNESTPGPPENEILIIRETIEQGRKGG